MNIFLLSVYFLSIWTSKTQCGMGWHTQWTWKEKPNTCNLLSPFINGSVKCFVCPFSIHIFNNFSFLFYDKSFFLSICLNYMAKRENPIRFFHFSTLRSMNFIIFCYHYYYYVYLTCNLRISLKNEKFELSHEITIQQ